MPGPQDPTISYCVHRGVLIGIVIVLLFATGYLMIQLLPGVQEWVASVIETVHDVWQ